MTWQEIDSQENYFVRSSCTAPYDSQTGVKLPTTRKFRVRLVTLVIKYFDLLIIQYIHVLSSMQPDYHSLTQYRSLKPLKGISVEVPDATIVPEIRL